MPTPTSIYELSKARQEAFMQQARTAQLLRQATRQPRWAMPKLGQLVGKQVAPMKATNSAYRTLREMHEAQNE